MVSYLFLLYLDPAFSFMADVGFSVFKSIKQLDQRISSSYSSLTIIQYRSSKVKGSITFEPLVFTFVKLARLMLVIILKQ